MCDFNRAGRSFCRSVLAANSVCESSMSCAGDA